uniref:NADH dehydrogenase [ubiquinone] 1 alpha subcomplex assembly factor 2 n=1 Tax=Falco tinnunculus TaxID=100819 RepID=A0A8C4V243_FALTI
MMVDRLSASCFQLLGFSLLGFMVTLKDVRKGQIIPERRFVEAINSEAYRYEMGDFPTEWEAWIRKRRKDPPTIEEILKNESYREEMKQKIKDVSEKDKLLQAKEYKEGLVAEPAHTQVKGHASAPYYGKKEPSQDPMSTANTFQPGSWMPPGSGSSHNK